MGVAAFASRAASVPICLRDALDKIAEGRGQGNRVKVSGGD